MLICRLDSWLVEGGSFFTFLFVRRYLWQFMVGRKAENKRHRFLDRHRQMFPLTRTATQVPWARTAYPDSLCREI
jgi:hypothetical protein